MGIEQIVILIRVGALRFTGKSKKELLWEVHLLMGQKSKPTSGAELFQLEKKNYHMPELINTALENAYHELELLGFSLSLSMFDLLKTSYRGEARTKNLKHHTGKVIKLVGHYVCEKTVHTKNNKKMWLAPFWMLMETSLIPPIVQTTPQHTLSVATAVT